MTFHHFFKKDNLRFSQFPFSIIKTKSGGGFTLIELLVIVGTTIILMGLAIPYFHFFGQETDVNNSAEEIINALRYAQNRTLASEGASQYGVFFSTSTAPNQYVLFKGASYASRDTAFDEVHQLPQTVNISAVNLGGSSEMVFQRLNGESLQIGSVILTLTTDITKQKIIYIEQAGTVGTVLPSTPSDASRLKDSRHVHIDYSRSIATATESLILTSGSYTQTIPIANNLKSGQIYWSGVFNVGGQNQQLKITTHFLDNPGSQFSIHRDRRYNNQPLQISLSGDASGYFISYSADGSTTGATSIYASNIQWQ